MELHLTDEEARLLERVLKNYLPDLREEVYKTEKFEWRQELKQDEQVLKGLILKTERLVQQGNAQPDAPAPLPLSLTLELIMSCREVSQREESVFTDLLRAVAHRERIDAKLAVYDDHWEGYEAALRDLEAAVQAYGLVAKDLREARATHAGA